MKGVIIYRVFSSMVSKVRCLVWYMHDANSAGASVPVFVSKSFASW